MAHDSEYLKIREFRNREISHVLSNSTSLNLFHEKLMQQTTNIAIHSVQERLGSPPSPFCFFVMGSAGRSEQGIWSDQDHGMIYEEGNNDTREYFLTLGKEISQGLMQAGYKKCDGNVMASNPFWCKSLSEWRQQLIGWVSNSTWESIRHLLTFIDGRSMYGSSVLLQQLKQTSYDSIHKEQLLNRILENTMLVKKRVGVLGQFLVDTHGPYSGLLNIKESGLYPFVNAARILAIHSRIYETSTTLRIEQLPDDILAQSERNKFSHQFTQLQNFRLLYGDHSNYESGHYLTIDELSKQQKKELKGILRDGIQLFDFAKKIVKRGG